MKMSKKRRTALSARVLLFFLTLTSPFALVRLCDAQAPASAAAPGQAKRGAGAQAPQVYATLAQLMRGILFPNSNVIFAAQSEDPAKIPLAKDPSSSTDPLASSSGGWTAVENSAHALSESANLLMISGRKCSNGIL